MNFDKLVYIFSCLNAGKALLNAQVWANRVSLVSYLSAFLSTSLVAIQAFGVDLRIGTDEVNQIALGISAMITLVGNIIHVMSNPNAGKVK
jgi:hypothetical protein